MRDWSVTRSIAGPGDQASPDHGSIGYSSEYRYFGTFRGFSYVNTSQNLLKTDDISRKEPI